MQNIPSHDCLLPLELVPLAPLTALCHGPGATSTFDEMGTGQVPLLCINEVWKIVSLDTSILAQGCPCEGQESGC